MSHANTSPGAIFSAFVDSFLSCFGISSMPAPPQPSAAELRVAEETRLADEAQRAELARLDPALAALGQAVLAVTAPVLRAAADAPTAGLTGRRDAIAAASTPGDKRALALTAPGLLAEINAARLAAEGHAATANRVAAHRTAAMRLLGDAKALIDPLATPGTLPGDHAALLADPSAGADAASIEATARDWEAAANQLLLRAQAARDAEVQALVDRRREQAAKLAEIDQAMLALTTARSAGTAPCPVDPDDTAVAALALRRKPLADAKTVAAIDLALAEVPGLLHDIAAAETDATDAEITWQALKLRADAAKRILNDARAYVNASTASPLKGTVGAELAKQEKAHADLGKAGSLALFATALGKLETAAPLAQAAAHGLWADETHKAEATRLLGILGGWATEYAKVSATHPLSAEVVRLRNAMQAAALEPDVRARGNAYVAVWQDAQAICAKAKQHDDLRKSISSTLVAAASWLKTAPKGSEGTLPADHAKATGDLTTLGGETSLGAFGTKLAALKIVADKLYDDCLAAAVPDAAERGLKNLASWLPDFRKLASANAVQTEYDRLLSAQNAAALLTGKPRALALRTVSNEANAACGAASEALEVKTDIARRLYALEQVPFKALSLGPADPLAVEKARILAALPTACSATANAPIATLKARFEALLVDVGTLRSSTDARQAAMLDVDDKTTEVEEALDTLDDVVKGMTAGTARTGFEQEAAAARQSLLDAGGLPGEAAQQAALFALGRRIEELMRRAGKAMFTELLSTPTGKALVDAKISSMGTTTADPAEQALCRAAMEARFNLTLDIPEGMSVERLPTLYALFSKVPASHVGHDKLTKLEYETDPDSGSSYYGGGKIVLNKIGSGTGNYTMKNQGNPSKEEKVNYYNATTLHEIGHAVDDKNGIMKFGDAAYGGWKQETIDSVAKALFDSRFTGFAGTGKASEADAMVLIKGLLEKGTFAKPASATAPHGSLFAQWDAISTSQGWKDCLAVRNPDSSPWERPVVCADGQAYHEAYAGTWYSYTHSERSKGISDYQWRAPGEWFAELYAYHHMLGKPVPACVEAAITT